MGKRVPCMCVCVCVCVSSVGGSVGCGAQAAPKRGHNTLFVLCDPSSWGGLWQLLRPHSEKSGTTKAEGQKGLWPEGLLALYRAKNFTPEGHRATKE